MHRQSARTACVGWAVGLLLTISASTALAGAGWDGIGQPSGPDWEIYNPDGVLHFDTPSSGTMYLNSLNHGGEIGPPMGYIKLADAAASRELHHATGWYFQTQVNSLRNVDSPTRGSWIEHYGADAEFNDTVVAGRICFLPDRVLVNGCDFSENILASYAYETSGLHTIRLASLPGSMQAELYVDTFDVPRSVFTLTSASLDGSLSSTTYLTFGDTSTGSDGEAYWSNFGVNIAPEPGTSSLLAIGGLVLLRRRRCRCD